MRSVHEETLLIELKQRIMVAFGAVLGRNVGLLDALKASNTNWEHVLAYRQIKALSCSSNGKGPRCFWKDITSDFFRVSCLTDDERILDNYIALKLDDSRGEGHVHGIGHQDLDPDARAAQLTVGTEPFDCWSVYKHADNSSEWLPCMVVGQRLKPEFSPPPLRSSAIPRAATHDPSDPSCYIYTVRFHRPTDFADAYAQTQGISAEQTFTREASEIIFTKDFVMNYQINFRQNSFNFAREVVKEAIIQAEGNQSN